MNQELQAAFDEFDWDAYFAVLNANPEGNKCAGCDHGNDYCANTTTNTFTGG